MPFILRPGGAAGTYLRLNSIYEKTVRSSIDYFVD